MSLTRSVGYIAPSTWEAAAGDLCAAQAFATRGSRPARGPHRHWRL